MDSWPLVAIHAWGEGPVSRCDVEGTGNGPGRGGHDLLGALELVGAHDQVLAGDDEVLSGPESRGRRRAWGHHGDDGGNLRRVRRRPAGGG